MVSHREYLDFILGQLSGLKGITYRAMMGGYIIYYRGRIAGGIYSDRLMVKPVEAAKRLMPDAAMEKPYEGAHEMLEVSRVDDAELLKSLFPAMFSELPEPKKKPGAK
jgi:TfoX/Sxy family transcriptional regulator of competence genes